MVDWGITIGLNLSIFYSTPPGLLIFRLCTPGVTGDIGLQNLRFCETRELPGDAGGIKVQYPWLRHLCKGTMVRRYDGRKGIEAVMMFIPVRSRTMTTGGSSLGQGADEPAEWQWVDGPMPEASKSNIHGHTHGKSFRFGLQPRRGWRMMNELSEIQIRVLFLSKQFIYCVVDCQMRRPG